MRLAFKYFLRAFALAVFFGHAFSLQGASVLSYHNDSASSGVNSTETILTPSNLTVSTFSKHFSTGVDGQIYAQPLYVPGVVVKGGSQAGTHNLAIVATQHDSLYAIDADTGVIVWQTSFLTTGLTGATSITSVPSADTGSGDTSPEIGVCSTPVIDGTTNWLYVAAKTKQIVNNATSTPNYVYTLYKIDITNGNATTNANIVSSTIIGDTVYNGSTYTFRTNSNPSAAQDPFVFGTGDGYMTVNGTNRVYFNALRQLNRPGLILLNNIVYLCFGSHGDMSPYHGWVLGYNKTSLAITAVCNLTPNGGLGGIWNAGGCPVYDSSGNIYLMTGNGTFDGDNSGTTITGLNAQSMPVNGDYGESFVKLTVDGTTSASSQNINGWGLKVTDYFTPYNNQSLSGNDTDLGSGACVLLPTTVGNGNNLLVGAGKAGVVYLVNCSSMGKFGFTDNVVQPPSMLISDSFDAPAFFNGVIYYCGVQDWGRSFTISNSSLSTTPTKTPDQYNWPGATPSISANGTSNGIVWMLDRTTAQLRAYSASSFGTEIWTSALASNNRDQLDSVTKFAVPTIADGHVLVGTTTALTEYGLTSGAPVITSGAPTSPASAGAAYNFNYTATGSPVPTFAVTAGSLPTGLGLSTTGVLSGTPSAPGTYSGAVTASNGVSPAANQSFTITINNTYSFWASQKGLTGANALQTAIISHDGLTNIYKYALGLNPFVNYSPGSSGLPLVQVKNVSGANYLALTFTGVATDVTYTVRASSDLSSWSTLYTSTSGVAPGTITVLDTQSITSPTSKRFMQLRVTSP